MKKLILICAVLVSGCTEPEHAKKILEEQGYTQVETGGYGWFACSDDDWFHTKFTALGMTGKPITGVVCSGLLFKNSTIRF